MATINVLKTILTAEDSGFSRTFKLAEESTKEFNRQMRDAEAVYKATRTPLENYEASVGKLNAMLKRGSIDQDTYNRAVRDAAASLPQAAQQTSALSGAFGKMVPVFDPISLGLRAVGAAAELGADAFRLMVDAVTSSIKKIDDLVDSAEKIGVATDALSALRYAAGFVGVEAGALDNAVGKMNVNINKAADEGGKAAEAFEKLGLDAKELRAMGPEKAFMAIADAVKAIDDPMQRANAAQAAFGKAGRDLIPLLMQGAAAIKAQRDEAELFGLVVSEIDAAKVGVAATNFDKLAGAAEGAALAFTKAIAPALQLVSDKLTVSIKEIGSMDRAMHNFVGNITADIGQLLNALDMMQRMNDAIVGFKLPDMETPLAGDKFVMEMVRAAKKAQEDARAAVRAARNARGGGAGDDDQDPAAQAAKGRKDAMQAEADRLRDSLRTPVEVLQDEIMKLEGMFAAGAIEVDTFNKALEKAEADFAKLDDREQKKMEDEQKKRDDKWFEDLAKKFEEADKLREKLKTPQEKREDEIKKLNEMFAQGWIDQDTRDKGIDAANKTTHRKGENEIGAFEMRSKEAFSAINRARGGAATGTAADIARRQLDVQRKQKEALDKLVAAGNRKPPVAQFGGF